MGKEMDFDFDNLEMDNEVKTSVIMYDENENLIQRLVMEDVVNISIDYDKKVFHAEYIGEGRNGIKHGDIFDVAFYKMVII